MNERVVKIENVKGIKALNFTLPDKPGVYLITGRNGCGKTTLLVALSRIANSDAFQLHLHPGEKNNIDQFNNAAFFYTVNGETVAYKRKNKRWVPTPKKSILSLFGYSSSLFLTASNTSNRYYSHEPKEIAGRRIRLINADEKLIRGLNEILSTNKFNDLKYIELKKRGRQTKSTRRKRIYVVDAPDGRYSEINFSLGERILLNALEYIHNVQPEAMLIIDEIELALHPIAQTKFYEYLKQQTKEKRLTIFVSSHSSSLVRHVDKKYFLENKDGNIKVVKNCCSSYILSSISAIEERIPDFVFFVEDVMARRYLHQLIINYKRIYPEDFNVDIRIVPVGGWRETIKFQQQFWNVGPLPRLKTQAFLDEDINQLITQLKNKDSKTDCEIRELELVNNNIKNITYLNITPELGVWNWLKADAGKFEDYLKNKSVNNIRVAEAVQTVSQEEEGKSPNNVRDHAKGCLKNLTEKISLECGMLSMENVYDYLFESYTQDEMSGTYKDVFINTIKMILNRHE